mmetsp:Transcript_8455/g.15297  ORF Transcript_8455/g.15297 Transcript_8455/m.15297 type:complete len:507 (+) Transcript_8455:1097-2617(+)|eukprot:CAMPEP_0201653310 /NCGR_PEP_ID=MMETSP0493-20130528/44921_1 /ASSEMBLY_ACC=CAM_ASM_000838 /TAXON_ID=420259 /ORGANISM="Thalassiosira gravida, Strain GMp14c1" /LENGTH=506 /DNA_ID=CAMNT_0048129841 /DNA_START=1451 /DNA_END=2971 /DNA_ORIENTATION=+
MDFNWEQVENALKLAVKSEYTHYGRDAETIQINVCVQAPECPDEARKPVDLVVVLDRSGSMAGSKLELCKSTLEFLVRELAPHDRLGLVSYDTRVQLELPLTRMDAVGKRAVTQAARDIHAGSATNLSGGLLAGLNEIQSSKRADGEPPHPVQSVLLLTDGLANHGVTNPDALVKLVKGALAPSVSLFTFGYGSGHHADLLRQLSDLGRGMYYFIQHVDGVSLAFADCLGGLLSVVAQNIVLTVETTADSGVTLNPLPDTYKRVKMKSTAPSSVEHQRQQIDLGDLYGEEQRDVLLQVDLPKMTVRTEKEMDSDVAMPIVRCNVTYSNILAAKAFCQTEGTLEIVRAGTLQSPRIPDKDVVAQNMRFLTTEAMKAAHHQAENGQLAAGQASLQAALDSITHKMEGIKKGGLDIASGETYSADLRECHANLASTGMYRARGQQRLVGQMQCHVNQRSNNIEMPWSDSDDDALAAHSRSVGGTFRSAYQSKKKGSMMAKARSSSGYHE